MIEPKYIVVANHKCSFTISYTLEVLKKDKFINQNHMEKRKKIFVFMLILLTTVGLAHAMVFPQQTRCILIDFHSFEKEGNLYFRSDINDATKTALKIIIEQAEKRVADFWGQKTSNPTFIYCETAEDYKKFGVPFMTPAAAHMKLGSYVVISKDGIDLDIISHEISHTELYERIGFYNREFKIPTWFDEGLAMQVDHRSYYSIDSLKVKSDGFENLPDVTKMKSYAQFGKGTRAAIMLNYSTAKYEVEKWYTPEKLETFIQKINDGADFKQLVNVQR